MIPHLRDDLGFDRTLREAPALFDRPRERFLHVDVLVERHRGQCHHGMRVIGRPDHDGVDVGLLLEHLAEVGIASGFVRFRFETLEVLDLGL